MSYVLDIPVPEPGQLVDVRQRRYVVVDVAQSMLPPDLLSAGGLGQSSQNGLGQHLVTLTSVEVDALGEELQVIWEIEPGARLTENNALPEPAGFDTPHRLDTFLNAVRWGAASSADVRALQAPFRSGIEIEDYQLDPVARAIQMPRVNLLIADDVGLGKTIEAGLVCQELLIRHRARKILIVCPAALQVQWREQMRAKFGLEFRIVDSDLMRTLRRERGLHVNPWTHFPRLVTSIDFLKRERPLRLFSEVLPPSGEPTYPRRFDLLIVDEAHNIAPSGRGQYATDSDRTRALRRVAPHFEHKLFLSATPHNGYTESFTALLELLDSQRFARGVRIDREQLQAVMIRRLKSELPPRWDGTPRFPRRVLEPLEVEYTPEERAVHGLLQTYTRLRLEKAGDEVEQFATEFVLKLLKKRLFSSPEAFTTTLKQHEDSLATARRREASPFKSSMGILRRQVEQTEEETDNDEALEEASIAALEAAAPLFREPSAEERHLLAQMRTWAAGARMRPDSKAARLISWLHETIKPVYGCLLIMKGDIMEANDIFSRCLTDLFSLYSIDDIYVNRTNGRAVLIKHFGMRIDEQVLQLEQELALKKEQLEAEIAKGRERLALEKGRAERDIGSRLEEVGLREAELDTRESLLHKQEKALDTMENDLRNMIRTQIANEIKLQAEQLDSRASELQVSENAIKVKEAELRAWEQRLSKKARDRDTKPGVVYEFRYPPTHAPVYVGRTTRDDPIKRIEEHLEDALNNENDFRTWIHNLYHNEHMLPEVAIVYETSGETENRRVERQHINDLLSRGATLFNVHRKVPLVDIKRELLVAEVAGEQDE